MTMRVLVLATALMPLVSVAGQASERLQTHQAARESDKAAISPVTVQPKTAAELLGNLQRAWDRKLLLQSDFWGDDHLRDFLNVARSSWDKPARPDEGWVIRTGTVWLNDAYFPGATATIRYSHQVAKAQDAPAIGVHVPAYTEDSATLRINLRSVSAFTWGSVTKTFGPSSIHVVELNPHGHDPESDIKTTMRYNYPGIDETQFSINDLPAVWFRLRQGVVRADPKTRGAPQDTDLVDSIRIELSDKK